MHIRSSYMDQQEAAGGQSSEEQAEFFDRAPVMMHTTDHRGVLLEVSRRWLETMGYQRQDVVGRNFTEFLSETSRDFANLYGVPNLQSKGSVKNNRYEFVRSDGSVIHVTMSVVAQKDKFGRFEKSLAALSVVERAPPAAMQNAGTPADLVSLTQTLPDSIVQCDPTGSICYANDTYREHFNDPISSEGIDAEKMFRGGLSERGFAEMMADITIGDPSRQFDQEFLDHSGNRLRYQWSLTMLYAGGRPDVMVAVGRDVTEQWELQNALKQKVRNVQRADQHKSKFVLNVSHEFKNPLNSIIGMTQILAGETNDEKHHRYLSNILAAGEQLTELLKDVVDVSMMETGRLAMDKTEFRIAERLSVIGSLYAARAQDAGKTVHFEIDHNCHAPILGAENRICQVVTNLLGNAINYADPGRILVRATLQGTDSTERLLKIEVSDQGPGLSDEAKQKIFERFERLNDSGVKPSGTGLGLTISRQICELHGGSLSVEDGPAGGSVFVASFKVGFEQKFVNSCKSTIAKLRSNTRKLSVLIVEDNEMNAIFMKEVMLQSGADVTVARNGTLGLEALKERDFDLVFSDMNMPEMGGLEMLTAWKDLGRPCDTIFILCSADTSPENGAQYKMAGFSATLEKPTSIHDIAELLEKYFPAES